MRAFLVCVDYSDFLSITLPWNRHHFEQVVVVTHPRDTETIRIAGENKAGIFTTDAFYENGALFNKWKALEQALSAFGRDGWICLMDADVLWPTLSPWSLGGFHLIPGYLYTPLRRMWKSYPKLDIKFGGAGTVESVYGLLPKEGVWHKFPLHPQQKEWAGYTQIFHGSDPALPSPPWHETNWKHAGGADSLFQAKWLQSKKLRPPFEVLHLGPAGENWAGRVTPNVLTGEVPPNAEANRERLHNLLQKRQTAKGGDRFSHERIT